MEIISWCFCIGNLTMEKHKCQHRKNDIDCECEREEREERAHLSYLSFEGIKILRIAFLIVSCPEIMAGYSRKDYIRRLGVKPKNGVYMFTFDEGNDVHDQLIGDLAMEFASDMPNDGDTVVINVDPKTKQVLAFTVIEKTGGRRSRLNKKTRRSKRKRGHTKRR
jgi:hypothetical protein